jgi:hypothetical protein
MVAGGNLDPAPGEAVVNGPAPGSRIPGNAQNLWIGALDEYRSSLEHKLSKFGEFTFTAVKIKEDIARIVAELESREEITEHVAHIYVVGADPIIFARSPKDPPYA